MSKVVDMDGKEPCKGVLITVDDFFNLKSWIESVNDYMQNTNIALEAMNKRIEALEGRKGWWR